MESVNVPSDTSHKEIINDILYSNDEEYYKNHPSLSESLLDYNRPLLSENLRGRIQVTWPYKSFDGHYDPWGLILWCTGTICDVKCEYVKRSRTSYGNWKKKKVWRATVLFDSRPPYEEAKQDSFILDEEKWDHGPVPNLPYYWRLLKQA